MSNTIILITNVITPYRLPLFNEINRQLRENGFCLYVIFSSYGYKRRKWRVDMSECDFEYEVLEGKQVGYLGDQVNFSFTYPRILSIIRKKKPFRTIVSGFSTASIKLWFYSYFSKVHYIIWSGAIETEGGSRLRRWFRMLLVRRAFGFIVYGQKAKLYLESFSAPSDKISVGINTTDTHFFSSQVEEFRQCDSNNKKRLLVVSYFVQGKQLDRVIALVKVLSKKRKDFILTLVGDGPEKSNMDEQIKKLQIEEYFEFTGYQQKHNIPKYLAQADCFLFPTDKDTWGMSLVEAMASSLPCIASLNAAACYDIIEHGDNGFIVDFQDIPSIIPIIEKLFDEPDFAKAVGKKAAKMIAENVTIEKSTQGFIEAMKLDDQA